MLSLCVGTRLYFQEHVKFFLADIAGERKHEKKGTLI